MCSPQRDGSASWVLFRMDRDGKCKPEGPSGRSSLGFSSTLQTSNYLNRAGMF